MQPICPIAAGPSHSRPSGLSEPHLHSSYLSRKRWDRAAQRVTYRPYLDPLVADAKRQAHLSLLGSWLPSLVGKAVLKTDLWEEGVAGDELLFTLADSASATYGIDVSSVVVAAARERAARLEVPVQLAEGDVLNLPLASGSIDVVVSTSTLDHLDDELEDRAALAEFRRVLVAGGVLVVTVDNRKNVFDWALRGASAAGLIPFPLGHAPRLERLLRLLEDAGLRPDGHSYLVPAPRLMATAAVRVVRALFRDRSDAAVVTLLRSFEAWGRRSPAGMGCFVAVRATAV
jgi:SAM-dependent methyltransferase